MDLNFEKKKINLVQQCSTTQGQSVSKAKKIIIMYFLVCDQNILGESAQISVDSIVFLPCNFPKRMTIRGLLSFYWWLEEKTRLKTNWTWIFKMLLTIDNSNGESFW